MLGLYKPSNLKLGKHHQRLVFFYFMLLQFWLVCTKHFLALDGAVIFIFFIFNDKLVN